MKTYKELQLEFIYARYKECKYNTVQTAKSLKLNRNTVHKILKNHPNYGNKQTKEEVINALKSFKKTMPSHDNLLKQRFDGVSARFIRKSRMHVKRGKI